MGPRFFERRHLATGAAHIALAGVPGGQRHVHAAVAPGQVGQHARPGQDVQPRVAHALFGRGLGLGLGGVAVGRIRRHLHQADGAAGDTSSGLKPDSTVMTALSSSASTPVPPRPP
jgi:hypothetical protein